MIRFLAFILVFWSSLASAEYQTTAAVESWSIGVGLFPTAAQACASGTDSASYTTVTGVYISDPYNRSCSITQVIPGQSPYTTQISLYLAATCPDDTWTFNDTKMLCEKPSNCKEGEEGTGQSWANAFAICDKGAACLTGSKTYPASFCDGSCIIADTTAIACLPTGTPSIDSPAPIYCTLTGKKTGETCTASNLPVAPAPPQIPQKKPPCADGEGVLTSSSGSVKCVPEGTPGAKPPVVTKEKKVETFPDATTKTTETTKTTDPDSRATTTSTTTTTTSKSGGGPGDAGTPGTKTDDAETSTNSPNNNTPGDDPEAPDTPCNPTTDFCGGPSGDGLYTKKTRTVSDAIGDFSAGVKGSSLGQAGAQFFNIGNHGGGCPSWGVQVPYLEVYLDIGQHFCSSVGQQAFSMFGKVLFVVASFLAFTWAFL